MFLIFSLEKNRIRREYFQKKIYWFANQVCHLGQKKIDPDWYYPYSYSEQTNFETSLGAVSRKVNKG